MVDEFPHPQDAFNFEHFSPYDIAVLAFTSPSEIKDAPSNGVVTLTGKDIYVWAGTIAFVVTEKPEITTESIIRNLLNALSDHSETLRSTVFSIKHKLSILDLEIQIVKGFLDKCGISSNALELIVNRADESRQKLENLGLIEDPFRKKILGIILGVVSILPVSFTSKTDEGGNTERHMNALAWEYVNKSHDNNSTWSLRIKVKEISDVFIQEIIPKLIEVIDGLSKGTIEEKKIGFLISQGVDDPNVYLFYYTYKNDVEKLHEAIKKGADVNITLEKIFSQYKDILNYMV